MSSSDKKVRGFFTQACMQTAAGGSAGKHEKENSLEFFASEIKITLDSRDLSRFRRSLHHASAGFDQNAAPNSGKTNAGRCKSLHIRLLVIS
jgi:hypothetical protein